MSGIEGISSQRVEFSPVFDDPKFVHEAQTALVDLGYNVKRNGQLDDQTRAALANFQSHEGLQYRDGRFDAGTLVALRGAVHGETNVSLDVAAAHVHAQTGHSVILARDSAHRAPYMDKIAARSDEAVDAIDMISPNGNQALVELAAEEVSLFRDAERAATQQKLTPGGRALSGALESPKSFDERVATKIAKGADEHAAYRQVAQGAGKSNPKVKSASKVTRAAGPVGAAVGVGVSVGEVAVAPEGQRGRVAAREMGSFLGGAAGATAGIAGGAAAGVAMAAGVASGPPGWFVLGAAMVGGTVLGYFGSKAGAHVGQEVYRALR